jgi:hypothetical protein
VGCRDQSEAGLVILGLDASTTVCGWCILKTDGTVFDAGHIKFDSASDLYHRLRQFREMLLNLFKGLQVRQVFIEEPKKMFGSKSTAHVMSLLQRWNGMVSAMISIDFMDPVLINEKSARKQIGINIPHKCSNAKLLVAQHVMESRVLPDILWQFKKTGKLKDHCLDIADAYVVARAGYLNGPIKIS